MKITQREGKQNHAYVRQFCISRKCGVLKKNIQQTINCSEYAIKLYYCNVNTTLIFTWKSKGSNSEVSVVNNVNQCVTMSRSRMKSVSKTKVIIEYWKSIKWHLIKPENSNELFGSVGVGWGGVWGGEKWNECVLVSMC